MWILLDLQPKAKFHICSTELGARKTSVYCHMLVRFLSFSLCHINAVIVNQLKNWQSFMAFHLSLVVFIFICLYLIWFSQISHCHEGRKWHINSRFYSLEILPQYEVYQYLNYPTILIYLAVVTGNIFLFLLMWADLNLHTLMRQLFVIVLALSSSTVPKMALCGCQWALELCNHHETWSLSADVTLTWIECILVSMVHAASIMSPPICSSREIYHFCEIPEIIMTSCKDTYTYELADLWWASHIW